MKMKKAIDLERTSRRIRGFQIILSQATSVNLTNLYFDETIRLKISSKKAY